ncbi:hypothetical protein [Amycolatopsis sp. NPDC021455]|uniref:hypothetical protein n=1 Tax=Amycolatopsis sp. NPDC021455 TaxID=3154901 RepID=UPI0033D737ED
MPTAIEYAVGAHWHTQNGSAGGPPAQNLTPAHAGVPPDISPVTPGDGWLIGGLPSLLLPAVVLIVAWRRRTVRADRA